MSCFPAFGIAAFLYFDLHPDWFLIPGGSAPRGLWHVANHDGSTRHERGNWIVVCPPLNEDEHRRLFVTEPPLDEGCDSQPSLKQIAAVPGDKVIVDFPLVITPLRSVKAIEVDAHGDTLPRPSHGDYTVAEGFYWVLSQNARSVDSRYYGPISTANITHTARPIFTVL